MYKKAFFKSVLVFFLLLFSGASFIYALNPSYLFLSNNQANTAHLHMVLAITPGENFSSGGELTVSFPDDEDGQWCLTDNTVISLSSISSSIVDIEGWKIDASLPGTLTARCYQGAGANSYDRLVISGLGALNSGITYGVQINPNANFSTGSNIGSTNIVVQLKRGLVVEATAFSIYLKGLDGVIVSAFVNQDSFSTVQILDPVVERGMWSRVRVRILDSQGNPIPGRNLELDLVLPSKVNWEIEQPLALTNSNGIAEGRIRGWEARLVNVTVKDKSFSQDVNLQANGWINVVNVPSVTLAQLPMYTVGTSRKINWNQLSGNYQYFIECSTQANFQTLYKTSGWVTGSEYTFQDLNYGQAFYYRAKVRNVAQAEGNYSNIVSSIQAEQPTGNIQVLDPIVEMGIWSRVRVRVLNAQGNPMSGRKVILSIDRSNLTNWNIEQPVNLTDANGYTEGRIRGLEVGTVKVTAVDRTLPIEFFLEGFDWLQVTQIPTITLHTLPMYSPGVSRLITWSALTGNYQYYIESSTNPNFNTVRNSGWISANQFVFQNLTHAQANYYRGKVRNSAGIESAWSNVVNSIQDNQGPNIEETGFEVSRSQRNIRFTFLITDLSGVSSVNFRCLDSEVNLLPCGNLSSLNSFHYIRMQEADLQDYKVSTDEYLLKFCVEAFDVVGNRRSVCGEKEISFAEPPKEIIEEPPKPTPIPQTPSTPPPPTNIVSRIIEPVRENVRKSLESFVVYVQDLDINEAPIETTSVAIVSTVTPITIFAFLFNPSSYYAVGQFFIAIFGAFKRKKKPTPYGFIYNSVSKDPINRAIVRIYRDKKLVATTVTNVYGVFTANLEPGEYFLRVSATEYIYPSKLITGSSDGPIENVYRGGKFSVEEESQLQYSIPLDPEEVLHTSVLKTLLVGFFTKIFMFLQKVLIFAGFLIAIFIYLRNPGTLNLAILIFYVPLIFVQLFLIVSGPRQTVGIVKDIEGKLVFGLALGLREMEFERVIAQRITNEKGAYKFLVPGGKYKLEALDSRYEIVTPKDKDLIFEGSVKRPLLANPNLVVKMKVEEKE